MILIKEDDQNCLEYHIDALSDIDDLLERENPVKNPSSSKDDSDDWIGCSWSEAKDWMLNGNHELAQKLDCAARQLAPKVNTPSRGLIKVHDVIGVFRNESRYRDGDPEHYVDYRMASKASPVLQVFCNISANCGYGRKDILRRGMIVYVAARALALKGIQTQIVAVAKSQSGNRNAIYSATVKRPGTQPSPGQIAYWIAHPAALRRSVFRMKEVLMGKEQRENFGVCQYGGYGRPDSLTEADIKALARPNTRPVHIERIGDVDTSSMVASVVEAFKKAGIEMSMPNSVIETIENMTK